ncbi:TldD/PmbA family protein [candidate division CSSED10-310 bacterium]|uniref:TldD/PmbA family protein n=1 Tax=candidate division CSSED10-310 bacterium TaxID=2855610 RepID=A0ABV6YX18_UNCC1
MSEKEMVRYCVDTLLKRGAHKAQCLLNETVKNEFNIDSDRISLLRTTYDTQLSLTALVDHRKGSAVINQIDPASINAALQKVIEFARGAHQDEANDIAEFQAAELFETGPESPDLHRMYDRLNDFLHYCKRQYPNTTMRKIVLDFTRVNKYFQNSNGVDLISKKGIYNFGTLFISKDAQKSSSFNHTGFSSKNLDEEIQNYGTLDELLKQSSEQIHTRSFPDKMSGDIIVTPDCLERFIYYIISTFVSDYALISGNSIFKDKLDQVIADPKLTLHSRPVSAEIADGYFITRDGYKARNNTIIEKGILKTFLLSLYGSRRTGKPRAVNDGQAFVVEPGQGRLPEMIKSVKRGLLLARLSGCSPSENGDFSGVAKNSYLIENGEIQYPLQETTIAGNLKDMLLNIVDITTERINFGDSIYPWIQFGNIVIAGKHERSQL